MCQSELARARLVESALDKKTGVAVAGIGEREAPSDKQESRVHGHRGIIAPIRGWVTIDDLAIVSAQPSRDSKEANRAWSVRRDEWPQRRGLLLVVRGAARSSATRHLHPHGSRAQRSGPLGVSNFIQTPFAGIVRVHPQAGNGRPRAAHKARTFRSLRYQ
jgi:hypothetical protein